MINAPATAADVEKKTKLAWHVSSDRVAVDVKNLTRTFGGQKGKPTVTANHDLTFKVQRGEIFGLLGPNGSGKTTLVGQLLGLVRPTSGSIWIEGIDVVKQPEAVKGLVGYLPQKGIPMRAIDVERALLYTGRLRGQNAPDARQQVDRLLSQLGLESCARHLVNRLSGGTLKLVNFGMALMGHPRLLILDEPTNDLDPQNRRLVWNLIAQLNKDEGVTCILVTHNVLEAEQVMHRVAVIRDGRFIALGRPEELKARVSQQVRVEFNIREGATVDHQLAQLGFAQESSGFYRIYAPAEQVTKTIETILTQLGLHNVDNLRVVSPSLEDVLLQLDSLTGLSN